MAESAKLEAGKIFVGGLSWDTTKESLTNYFTKYGDVIDGVIMVDSVNKMPRGFGFVTFKDPSSVIKVVEANAHFLDGKKIDPKEAITKDHHASSQLSKSTSIEKKVFVGGLPHGCSVDEIKSFFGKYGIVTEVDVKIDRATSKPRGFAFVEYKDVQNAIEATKKQFQMFKEKRVEVKPAENRIPGASPATVQSQWSGYGHTQQSQSPPSYNYIYGYTPSPVGGFQGAPGNAYTQQPYTHPHTAAQQQVYQHPQSSYHQNGFQPYQQPTSYQTQSYTTPGYTQQGYSTAGYTQQYNSSYTGQAETVIPYQQSQASSGYYPNTNYNSGYSSDQRYQQAQNQRNW